MPSKHQPCTSHHASEPQPGSRFTPQQPYWAGTRSESSCATSQGNRGTNSGQKAVKKQTPIRHCCSRGIWGVHCIAHSLCNSCLILPSNPTKTSSCRERSLVSWSPSPLNHPSIRPPAHSILPPSTSCSAPTFTTCLWALLCLLPSDVLPPQFLGVPWPFLDHKFLGRASHLQTLIASFIPETLNTSYVTKINKTKGLSLKDRTGWGGGRECCWLHGALCEGTRGTEGTREGVH